jgi:hypothetical protein
VLQSSTAAAAAVPALVDGVASSDAASVSAATLLLQHLPTVGKADVTDLRMCTHVISVLTCC